MAPTPARPQPSSGAPATTVLAGVRATAATRQVVALAAAGRLRPHLDGTVPTRGRVRIVVNGPGQDALFGAIYVGAQTGRVLHAVLTHGNNGQEKRYDGVASIRAVLKSWLAQHHGTRPAEAPSPLGGTRVSRTSGSDCHLVPGRTCPAPACASYVAPIAKENGSGGVHDPHRA